MTLTRRIALVLVLPRITTRGGLGLIPDRAGGDVAPVVGEAAPNARRPSPVAGAM